MYHWTLSGGVPFAMMFKFAVCPEPMVWLRGWVTIVGATPTVIVAVIESAEPYAFEIRTQ
jgi:hypothetical protein